MHFIEKFDGEDIDGQHLRPPVLAILETIERNNFDGLLVPNPSIFLQSTTQYIMTYHRQ